MKRLCVPAGLKTRLQITSRNGILDPCVFNTPSKFQTSRTWLCLVLYRSTGYSRTMRWFVTILMREGAAQSFQQPCNVPHKTLPTDGNTAAATAIDYLVLLNTDSQICTHLATRVRYTTVNLRWTASARDFLPSALLADFPPDRRLRLHPLFLYNRRAYAILCGISTLRYRVL